MTERFSTGDPRLDAVLGGGLVRNSITVISGAPGSGKTLLAEKCLFANATAERPGLYLSTVSEPLDKVLRYGQSLSFFDAREVGRSVIFECLGAVLTEGGLPDVLKRLDELVKEHHPCVVVIDSFKAVRSFATTESDFRRFLHVLAGRLTAVAVSSLWVGEYAGDDVFSSPELAVADGVVELATEQLAGRCARYLSVPKLRGAEFAPGQHAYRLSSEGLVVYPRLVDAMGEPSGEAEAPSVPTGMPALDEALGDGYWPGSATVVAGPSGAGKTTMGLHFLLAGAAVPEPGVLLALQEPSSRLARALEGFGWRAGHPMITIMERSPVGPHMDQLAYELLECVAETKARRVVIDTVNDLVMAAPDEARLRELIYALVRRFGSAGVSVMFLLQVAGPFALGRLTTQGVPRAADNVVLLQHVLDGPEVKRALIVVKTRGSPREQRCRELRITSAGMVLGKPLDAHVPAGARTGAR
jgi:circadian clock protein KaiC